VNVFIQINTDNQVDGNSERDSRLEEQVRQRLARFEGRITDVEIHVSDDKSGRGDSMRCTLEARVNGVQPVAVAEHGANVDRAVIAAAKKVVRALDHQLGKLNDKSRH
jgi:ribosome-associated translation inhibitor RaiA